MIFVDCTRGREHEEQINVVGIDFERDVASYGSTAEGEGKSGAPIVESLSSKCPL